MTTQAIYSMPEISSSRSSSDRDRVPDDIVFDILMRLPTKSVVRFTAVSKQWLRTISKPFFRDRHSDRSPPDPYPTPLKIKLWAHSPDTEINIHPHQSRSPNLTINRRPYILGNTCNGLLCFYFGASAEDYILLCNPITGEQVTLLSPPNAPVAAPGEYLRSTAALGFGPSTKVYKVVHLTYRRFQGPGVGSWAKVEVCTLQAPTKLWRGVQDVYFSPVSDSGPVLINGRIHWLGHFAGDEAGQLRIMAFDVESEEVMFLQNLPPFMPPGMTPIHLAELGGRLALVTIHQFQLLYEAIEVTEVWVLEDCTESRWELRHRIKYQHSRRKRVLRFVNMWECNDDGDDDDGDDDDDDEGVNLKIWFYEFMLSFDGQRASLLEHKKKKIRRHQALANNKCRSWKQYCKGYKPSLVSLMKYWNCDQTKLGKAACMHAAISFNIYKI